MQAIVAPLITDLAHTEGIGLVPNDAPVSGNGLFGQLVLTVPETSSDPSIVTQQSAVVLQVSPDDIAEAIVSNPAENIAIEVPVVMQQVPPLLENDDHVSLEQGVSPTVRVTPNSGPNMTASGVFVTTEKNSAKVAPTTTRGDDPMGQRPQAVPETIKIADAPRAVVPVLAEVPIAEKATEPISAKDQTDQPKPVQTNSVTSPEHKANAPSNESPTDVKVQTMPQAGQAVDLSLTRSKTGVDTRSEITHQTRSVEPRAQGMTEQGQPLSQSAQATKPIAAREIVLAQINRVESEPQKGAPIEFVQPPRPAPSDVARPSQTKPLPLRDTSRDIVSVAVDGKPLATQPDTKTEPQVKSDLISAQSEGRTHIQQDVAIKQTIQPSKAATISGQTENVQNRILFEANPNVSKAPIPTSWVPPVAQPYTTTSPVQQLAAAPVILAEGNWGEIVLREGEGLQHRDLGAVRESAIAPPRVALVPNVVAQIAEVARQLPNGPVEVSLAPEELGKVRMALSQGEASMAVQITVERPETLDLIRRHIDLLAGELRDQGFENLSFEFQGGRGQSDQAVFDQEHDGLLEEVVNSGTPHVLSGSRTEGLDLRL